jgi:hypothetical protein
MWNGRLIYERLIGKDLEGCSHGLIGVLCLEGLRKTPKNLRIADIMAEIQSEHLLDFSPEHYWFTSPLIWPASNGGNIKRREHNLLLRRVRRQDTKKGS